MNHIEQKIKKAIKTKILRYHYSKETSFVIDELPLNKGKSRIDIAIFSNYFHGLEIKSNKDTLYRLKDQIQIYNQIFEKIDLIVGYKHFFNSISLIPDWWGIKIYDEGKYGAIHFSEARRGKINKSINKYHFSQLFLKNEIIEILTNNKIHFDKTECKKILIEILVSNIDFCSLKYYLKKYLSLRKVHLFD